MTIGAGIAERSKRGLAPLAGLVSGVFRWAKSGVENLLGTPGASLSVAMCRIALFYSTLLALIYLDGAYIMRYSASTFFGLFAWEADFRTFFYYDQFLVRISGTPWVPKGLVKIFFASGPPSPDTMYAITVVAYISTLSAIAGFLTRLSAPISVLSVLMVSSIFTSWGAYWSHGFNVVHLAGLAFMFARSGDRLSVDTLISKLFTGKWLREKHRETDWRWPVVVGELATHMFLFGAFFSKMLNGNGIMWALSDNLRNSLALTWGAYRSSPPLLIDFVMSNIWAFKFVGLSQVLMQGTTIFSCLLIRRPIFRALLGAVVLTLEILGLGVLFEFWHWLWLPLIAFSIDWDWLERKIRGLPSPVALVKVRWEEAGLGARALAVYFGLFFAYYAANILFQLGERHLNYPFSSMAFFSGNRSLPPYSEHFDWPELRGRIRIFEKGASKPLDLAHVPSGFGELWRAFNTTDRVGAMNVLQTNSNANYGWCLSPGELKARDRWKSEYAGLRGASYESICQHVIAPEALGRIELYASLSVVPAAPEPPLPMVDMHTGLIGIREGDRTITIGVSEHLDPDTRRWWIEFEPKGFDPESMEVLTRENPNANRHYRDLPPARVLKGIWKDRQFMLDETEHREIAHWTLIRVKDDELGELTFFGPILYPYDRHDRRVRQYGKPFGR
jgi:hypothetical protein